MIESGSRFDGYFDSEFQRLSSIASLSSIPLKGLTRSDADDLLSNYNVLEASRGGQFRAPSHQLRSYPANHRCGE
ncbi:hypothetical protein CDAR_379981 [Caerostris darwini]|uniref:Uncharacterized protein n=1 Tax=Caerostris darwini TaxID=1538125 RepID=A0AAV4V9H6_9ARAC|nr:hypothetical protein CDAR_379981 [Caerostris darwini]